MLAALPHLSRGRYAGPGDLVIVITNHRSPGAGARLAGQRCRFPVDRAADGADAGRWRSRGS